MRYQWDNYKIGLILSRVPEVGANGLMILMLLIRNHTGTSY